jgi:translocation and assembly module TamA
MLAAVLTVGLTACGAIIPDVPGVVATQQHVEEAERLLQSDPKGPIPKPKIPSSLAEGQYQTYTQDSDQINYTVDVRSPDEKLIEIFNDISDLTTLKDKAVSSSVALNRRVRTSISQAQDLLRSQGYYEGMADGDIELVDKKADITIILTPGPIYTVENSLLTIENDPALAQVVCPAPLGAVPCPAAALSEVGLKPGEPAIADVVLKAADVFINVWRNDGYPQAEMTTAKYSIDMTRKTLLAEMTLKPGPYVKMGQLIVGDDSPVEFGYLKNKITWEIGQNWSQEKVERFREALLQTGLFKSVETSLTPQDDSNGLRGIVLDLQAAPLRTVRGSINFDSNFGVGLELGWEHRNFTGWGDRLRLDMPIWTDLFQLAANYQRPYFLHPKQNLLMEGALIHEKADSYTLSAASAAVGIDRQLSPKLRLLVQASTEVGELDEELIGQKKYLVLGLPVSMEWNDSDSYLDPTKGLKIGLLMSPYYGRYLKDFQVLKYRLDASFYQPIASPDALIFALRLAVGAISGSGPQWLPSSLRFFGGGGKSVRGYEYQSIGPLNARGRPAGGASMSEVSTELRWRWSKNLGFTAFVDGGMVYEKPKLSDIGRGFLWGGGLGVRYYSPIGPFRLDLATPLTPREGDGKIQLYLSLGQSF